MIDILAEIADALKQRNVSEEQLSLELHRALRPHSKLPHSRNFYELVLARKFIYETAGPRPYFYKATKIPKPDRPVTRVSFTAIEVAMEVAGLTFSPPGGVMEVIHLQMSRRGWTSAQLASEAGVAERTIYRLMRDGSAVNVATLNRLLHALDVKVTHA